MTETMKLETTEERLRNALAWYGEQARLARLIHSEGDPGRWALAEDGGKRAREVLALAVAPGVEVKPLEWENIGEVWFEADTVVGTYRIQCNRGEYAWCIDDDDVWHHGEHVGTLEAAKSAAQADYTARIMSALDAPQVKEIDGGRFEEWSLSDFAAQCRMQSREQLDPEFSQFMAALAKRLSRPSGIKVKPLKFEEAKAGIWTSGLVLGGEYRIMLTAGKGFQVSRGTIAIPDNQTWFPLLEIAEAAAQADYTARIMSALETNDHE